MRLILRKIIFFIFYAVYIPVRPFIKKNGVPVLMYHSVADDGDFFSVPLSEFGRQMEYIAKYCRAVPAGDVISFVTGRKTLPQRAVAITFDDGYRSFRTDALPILEKYRIPALVFVLAGEPDRKELGNEAPLLSPDEVRELADSGQGPASVEIGSHGLTHKKLTRLASADAENEIRQSRVLLNKATGKNIRFFAYPKGSFSGPLEGVAEDAGYEGAFSVIQRLSRPGGDRFAVPRLQIDRTTSFMEFKAKLTPVADWYYALWGMTHR